MSDRDRDRSYRERNRTYGEPAPTEPRREWREYNERSFGGSRYQTERDYADQFSAYDPRRHPLGSGYYEDPRRGGDWARGYEIEAIYYGYGADAARDRERQRENQRDRPFGFDRTRSASHGEGRYGVSDWDRAPRYSGERDEGLGQQLRDVSGHVVRKVKRAFRGPKGYKRSDERIREDVNDRLAQQDQFDPSDVEVVVSGGEVTLTGQVDTRHAKFLAEEIADEVHGVLDVHNRLRVQRAVTSTLSDSAIANQNEQLRHRNARA